ncbi:hypothetical protein ACF0L7_00425 [Streptococcus pyogenes]|uniref:hypothetical protein n=1 Tax=Streptococcus pyogenes TaxID=1314 RepID=UPI0004BE3759|nr:hypothetical protein [Streptococcus pyogenes]HER4737433.1 hypothetical protein [Streptococcus pyogenes NGAS311]UEN97862.1 hypothetical protein H7786_02185 [Streptococcus pyogenes]VGS66904.1 hypothetical membrane associated protein [Streptococcus pyogenes]VGT96641.1 hypothetical membrane associated protein [Streptococcus pyogenes]VGU59176.1 hypothetical membrane associated protein [Streptococcus pyogenes]
MKTKKSKRFLNLATLCLALLGTTLLMGQPVKAEVTWTRNEGSSELTNQAEQQGGTSGRHNSFGSSSENGESWGESVDSYDKGRADGYKDGYERGQQDGAPREFEGPIPNDSTGGYTDSSEVYWYKEGYKDTFKNGYYEGWASNNIVQATLEWLWTTITSWFFGTSS